MKKRLFVIIFAFSFLLTACTQNSAETNNTLPENTPVATYTTPSSHTLITDTADTPAFNENAETGLSLPPSAVDDNKPMVAITFDDGPGKYTQRLLDILSDNGGKATFFVIGNTLDKKSELLKLIAEEGHEIGSHSWDHRQLTKLTDEEIADQIKSTKEKIYDITGRETNILRPPYGSVNENVTQVCKDNGVIIVKWSVDPHDWKNKDTNTIYEIIMANLDDGDIILCHDIHATTIDAMEIIIPSLIEKGYQLVTVSELLNSADREIIAGEIYSHKYD